MCIRDSNNNGSACGVSLIHGNGKREYPKKGDRSRARKEATRAQGCREELCLSPSMLATATASKRLLTSPSLGVNHRLAAFRSDISNTAAAFAANYLNGTRPSPPTGRFSSSPSALGSRVASTRLAQSLDFIRPFAPLQARCQPCDIRGRRLSKINCIIREGEKLKHHLP